MEGHEHRLHAHITDFLEQVIGEVEAGGGGRNAPRLAGVHRLVTLWIVQGLFYIGRQRGVPETLDALFGGQPHGF